MIKIPLKPLKWLKYPSKPEKITKLSCNLKNDWNTSEKHKITKISPKHKKMTEIA